MAAAGGSWKSGNFRAVGLDSTTLPPDRRRVLEARRQANVTKDKALYQQWRAAGPEERPAIERQRSRLSDERLVYDVGSTRARELLRR